MELLPWMAIWFRLVLFYLRGMSWALWKLDVFCFSYERWVTNTPFGFLSNPVTTVGLFCKICTDFIVIGAAVVSRLSTQVVNQVPFFSCTWMGKGFALHWIILNGHPLDRVWWFDARLSHVKASQVLICGNRTSITAVICFIKNPSCWKKQEQNSAWTQLNKCFIISLS